MKLEMDRNSFADVMNALICFESQIITAAELVSIYNISQIIQPLTDILVDCTYQIGWSSAATSAQLYTILCFSSIC